MAQRTNGSQISSFIGTHVRVGRGTVPFVQIVALCTLLYSKIPHCQAKKALDRPYASAIITYNPCFRGL